MAHPMNVTSDAIKKSEEDIISGHEERGATAGHTRSAEADPDSFTQIAPIIPPEDQGCLSMNNA